MKRILTALLLIACLATGITLAQTPVIVKAPGGGNVPVATTSELTHGATAPTWTAVVGLTDMARASATSPTPVTANQPVVPWAFLDGARAHSLVPQATGGPTPGYHVALATNNSTNIKASAGQLYSFTAVNVTASLKFLRFYNSASAPTCTSSTGVVFYSPIPGSATNPVPLTLSVPVGKTFSTGIGFCITGAAGVTDNTSTAAGDVVLTYDYK